LQFVEDSEDYPQVFVADDSGYYYFVGHTETVLQLNKNGIFKGVLSSEVMPNVVLLSENPTAQQVENFGHIQRIFNAKKLRYTVVESSKPEAAAWRQYLEKIHKPEDYPVVYRASNPGNYRFIGDIKYLQSLLDKGKFDRIFNVRLGVKVQRPAFNLDQYPGSKIWQLNEEERLTLWQSLDWDDSGVLNMLELKVLAKAWFDQQMKRGDSRAGYLTDHEARRVIRMLRDALRDEMDLDHDHYLEKEEFIKKWNQTAKKAFQEDSQLCNIS